ncbi:hypothetical protein ACQP3C_31440, partial [Escherichia coli]
AFSSSPDHTKRMKKGRGVHPCYSKRKTGSMLVDFLLTPSAELDDLSMADLKGDKKMVLCTGQNVFMKECSQALD